MNVKPSLEKSAPGRDLTAAIARRFLQIGLLILIQAAILFGASGHLDWVMAWVYLGLYIGMIAVNAVVLLPRHPELIAERGQIKANAKGWDKVFSVFYAVFSLGFLVVAGLDKRFAWSPPFPVALELAGVLVVAAGSGLLIWAMASNRFFSSVVRIQTDRGHTVATGGPYQFVRHPGYVSMLISAVGTIAMLGSVWALIPMGLLAGSVIVRTALEDQTLHNELAGYAEYARRVRYRLLPGVW